MATRAHGITGQTTGIELRCDKAPCPNTSVLVKRPDGRYGPASEGWTVARYGYLCDEHSPKKETG